ncbi:MAG TPA: lipocalin-like domain-containing protein [Candidatus Cybelea sp.]|nr:lipocalin-like domain-containing protein [Candidatus Cybelea sp.]
MSKASGQMGSPLVGTWRVERFERRTADGEMGEPLGPTPGGYAVFDATGHAFIQLYRPTEPNTPAKDIARSFIAYCGPFSVNDAGDELAVTVEGSNLADYVGSVQRRRFRIEGDRMSIGVEGQYGAKLRRVG